MHRHYTTEDIDLAVRALETVPTTGHTGPLGHHRAQARAVLDALATTHRLRRPKRNAYERFATPILFRLNPETAHNLTMIPLIALHKILHQIQRTRR